MNFEDEPYVRLYKRKTVTTKLVGWEGRTTLHHLMLETDRAGVFDLDGEDPAEAVAALTELPLEVVRVGLARLLERKVVMLTKGVLLLPRYIEAQEARQSDSQRQRDSRERRRALVRLDELGIPTTITERDTDDGSGDEVSRNVTEPSRLVTPSHSSSADLAQQSITDQNPPNPQGGVSTPTDSKPEEDPKDDTGESEEARQKAIEQAEVVRTIFAYWQTQHGHQGAKLDRKRRGKIIARLREGFTPRELCVAIKAAKKDPFLMGDNERGKQYDGIQTLLRDAAKVEELLKLAGTSKGANGSRVVSPPVETWTQKRERLMRDHTIEELETMGEMELATLKRRAERSGPTASEHPPAEVAHA